MRDAVHTEEYRGYQIDIVPEHFPENPWKMWDGNPPIAIHYDRGIHTYGDEYGNANEVPSLTREQIKANLPEILEFLSSNNEPLSCLSEWRDNWQGSLEDTVNVLISDCVGYQYDSDRLDVLQDIWHWSGVPAYCGSTTGYSQGDYAEVLVVATDKFLKATGLTKERCEENDYEILRHAVKLYGYWAWGDVYGFVITEPDGENGDSCLGFYGDYDPRDESRNYGGAVEAAKSSIDSTINYRKEQKAKAAAIAQVEHEARTGMALLTGMRQHDI